jgi:hypothetical protein
MERTWKPQAAGMLSIIAGTIIAVIGFIVVFLIWFGGAFLEFLLQIASEPHQDIPALVWFDPGVLIVILVIVVLAIVGGICALKRRIWGLALAGSICALFPFVIPGILAIVFISLSKREFESTAMVAEETTDDTSAYQYTSLISLSSLLSSPDGRDPQHYKHVLHRRCKSLGCLLHNLSTSFLEVTKHQIVGCYVWPVWLPGRKPNGGASV